MSKVIELFPKPCIEIEGVHYCRGEAASFMREKGRHEVTIMIKAQDQDVGEAYTFSQKEMADLMDYLVEALADG